MTTIYLTFQVAPSEWPEWMENRPVRVDDGLGPMAEFTCSQCGNAHLKLWTIKRRMVDTFGHFPVFAIGGEERIVDGTLPTVVAALPRGAATVPQETAERIWHSAGHYFGEGA